MSQPNMQLPPVRSAQHSVAHAGAAAARLASTAEGSSQQAQPVAEDDTGSWAAPVSDAPGQAPAPLTAQPNNVAASLARRANAERVSEPVAEAQEMTLADLATLVEKQKRGVKSVMQADITEAADWDPRKATVIVSKAQSGADLTRRMLKGARRVFHIAGVR